MTQQFQRARAVAVALAVAAAAVAAPCAAYASDAEPFTWRGTVAAGKTLEIRGVNGRIEATGVAAGQVEIDARRHGERSNPNDVKIEVVEHEGGVTVCAVYPDAGNTCKPGGGRMAVRDNDVKVDFTVKVPAGVLFKGATVNGNVRATGIASQVDINTVNGSIDFSTSSTGTAKTVNGAITASVGKVAEPLEFKTVNGSITLSVPADLAATVEGSTVNGGIQSDLPLTVEGKFGPRHITGTIGGGGPRITLQTVNGGIAIRKG
jgi:hypothetical protein